MKLFLSLDNWLYEKGGYDDVEKWDDSKRPLDQARLDSHYGIPSIKPYYCNKLNNYTKEVPIAMSTYNRELLKHETLLAGSSIDNEKYFSLHGGGDDKEERRNVMKKVHSDDKGTGITGSQYRMRLITTPSREELVVGMWIRMLWIILCWLFLLPWHQDSFYTAFGYAMADLSVALIFGHHYGGNFLFVCFFMWLKGPLYYPLSIADFLIPGVYAWKRSTNIVYGGARSLEDRKRFLYRC